MKNRRFGGVRRDVLLLQQTIMTASLDNQPLLGNRVSARATARVVGRADTKRGTETGRERELLVYGESAIKVLTTGGKPQQHCYIATASITALPAQMGS